MNVDELRTRVQKWDSQDKDPSVAEAKYARILSQLEYHAHKAWNKYQPTENDIRDYMRRLAIWLDNCNDENDQKLLLEYALYIGYFSEEDFKGLYNSALNDNVFQWVSADLCKDSSCLKGDAFHTRVSKCINEEIQYCPVTNSMSINHFTKINNISRVTKSISSLASCTPYMLFEKMSDAGKNRLVLLEDFVGTGLQVKEAIEQIARAAKIPVLFIPLIICPQGLQVLNKFAGRHGNFSVHPVVQVHEGDLIGPQHQSNARSSINEDLVRRMEKLARNTSSRVSDGAFGFKDTGCSVVLHTNTPNNTLSIVHNTASNNSTNSWKPLFRRVDS